MLIRQIFLGIIGLCGGVTVAGGTFALLVKVGIFTRIMEFLRLGKRSQLIENALVLGGIAGNLLSVFFISAPLGQTGVLVFGLFSGLFVGWLEMALAETLDVITVMLRRIRMKYGLGCVVLFFGIGKIIGGLLYFYNHWGADI